MTGNFTKFLRLSTFVAAVIIGCYPGVSRSSAPGDDENSRTRRASQSFVQDALNEIWGTSQAIFDFVEHQGTGSSDPLPSNFGSLPPHMQDAAREGFEFGVGQYNSFFQNGEFSLFGEASTSSWPYGGDQGGMEHEQRGESYSPPRCESLPSSEAEDANDESVRGNSTPPRFGESL